MTENQLFIHGRIVMRNNMSITSELDQIMNFAIASSDLGNEDATMAIMDLYETATVANDSGDEAKVMRCFRTAQRHLRQAQVTL